MKMDANECSMFFTKGERYTRINFKWKIMRYSYRQYGIAKWLKCCVPIPSHFKYHPQCIMEISLIHVYMIKDGKSGSVGRYMKCCMLDAWSLWANEHVPHIVSQNSPYRCFVRNPKSAYPFSSLMCFTVLRPVKFFIYYNGNSYTGKATSLQSPPLPARIEYNVLSQH